MLNENAKKWVEALRSGKYKQTVGKLRTDDRFCCLGVACELAVESGVISRTFMDTMEWKYENEYNFLPFAVRKWLGLRDISGSFKKINQERNTTIQTCLADQNDNGKTFFEIADIIESEPHGLFIGENNG